jgi:hypothetical protein
MIVLTTGQMTGTADLAILVRDASGNLVDPVLINYTIYKLRDLVPTKSTVAYEYDLHAPLNMDGGPPLPPEGSTLASPPQQAPIRASLGTYYAKFTIPITFKGVYKIVWQLQQYAANCPQSYVHMDFIVQTIDPVDPAFEAPSMVIGKMMGIADARTTPAMFAQAVRVVRELIADTNPDRNYHFRPPTPGKVVANYTTRVGFIWLDTTILVNLAISISKLNLYNPMNYYGWNLNTIPLDWGNIAALGAASLCLSGESARWAADEFSYSLNGISLDINKSALYQSLAQTYDQQFTVMAPLVTANRPISAGLRQQRWLLGAFIPFIFILPHLTGIFRTFYY